MFSKETKVQQNTLTCGDCGKPFTPHPNGEVCRCGAEPVRLVEAEADDPTAISESVRELIAKNLGDRYEVISLLGQGGMGAVYKVHDHTLNKTLAIKVLNSALVEDKKSIKRFEQEAQSASNLTHANLGAIYEFGMGKAGAPYLVMDYLPGKNLGDIIKSEGYLDVQRAIDVFIQTAEAIEHAHMKGVIHRDVKPANIIINRDEKGIDYVKLVDFGIAKVLPGASNATKNLTQTGEIFGSPLYMSPEQCLGNPLDGRSDIYALGCVMFESLTGKAAFDAENPIKTIFRHVNEDPPAIHHSYNVPETLKRVIAHCLDREPDKRYQTVSDLLRDLRIVRDNKKIPLQAPALATTIRKQNEKGAKLLLAMLVGVIFSLGGMISYYFLLYIPSHQPSAIPAAVSFGNLDPIKDAQQFDNLSFQYFNAKEYGKAAALLEFGISTYKENGSRMPNNGETSYLADNLQHLGKCYLMMDEPEKAVKPYRDALRI